MRRILLLAAGDPFHRHIGRLKTTGYGVVVLDRNSDAMGRAHADAFVLASVNDTEAIINAARTYHIDAIVALTEAGVRAAAEASHYLGLPGLPIDVAHAATDKGEMRKRWQSAGLRQPDFEVAKSIHDARAMIGRGGLPCVVKPTRGWSSIGVSVVAEGNEIEPALLDAFAVHRGPVIIERFVPGKLLTAEGFVSDRSVELVAVGDVDTQEADRHRVNMSLQYPASFQASTMSEAADLIGRAARSLGLTRSPFHCECMVGPQGVYLIEMAARGGGGHIFTVLYEQMAGFSGIERQVRLLLQEDVDSVPDSLPHGGCYKFLTAPAGVVDRIEGAEEASGMPGVIDLGIAIKPGQAGGSVTHDNARHGHVCTIGADRTQALKRAEAAAACVRFIMRSH